MNLQQSFIPTTEVKVLGQVYSDQCNLMRLTINIIDQMQCNDGRSWHSGNRDDNFVALLAFIFIGLT